MATSPETALLAAVAVHAGFQLTVTTLVYPALFRAPDWERAHATHSRSITPLVAAAHGKLSAGRDPALVRRLRAADLVRTAGALLALAGALVAVW